MASIIPKVTQISPRIIRILGCNPGPMTLQGTNTYLIGTGKNRVLLDTGEENNSEYITSLVDVLKNNSTDIDSIILSHWHNDHIGGLANVLKLSSGNISVSKFPRLEDETISNHTLHPLSDKDEIKVEGATLKVHHTPGHTTDHIVLELTEENALFSGDCILGEGTAVFEDLHSYLGSLNTILNLSPSIIYPGHGPIIQDPVERIQHYIEHRTMRENQILQTLNDHNKVFVTSMELVKIIYKETPEYLHFAAENNVIHHLDKLQKDNKVKSADGLWGLIQRCSQL